MDNNCQRLLFDHIKLSYPNNKVLCDNANNDNVMVNGVPFQGIHTEIQGIISISLKEFYLIDSGALITYLIPRLKFEECKVFYKATLIKIYPGKVFTNDKKGNFEKAMWTFKIFQRSAGLIKYYVENILEGKA